MKIYNRKNLPAQAATLLASALFSAVAAAASDDRTITYSYNDFGLVTSIDGPRVDVDDITTYSYDAQGNRTAITNAAGQTVQITAYDATGRPLTIVDPNGLTTQLQYDPRGRLISQDHGGEVTTYQYDGVGNLTRATLPDGSFIAYEYDAAHRLIVLSDTTGNRLEYTLDNAGNRIQEQLKDNNGVLTRTSQRVYDELSRLRQLIGAAGQTSYYDYDLNDNPTQTTDPLGRITYNSYDALNRLTQTTDPAQGVVDYQYDAQDHLIAVTDPNGHTTQYSYDALDNRLTQQSPDTGATQYSYDEAGNLLARTDANGHTTQYAYDALNRLTQTTYSDGRIVSYSYDQGENGIGRLNAIQDSAGITLAYQYGPQGRLTKKSQTLGDLTLTLRYGYDASGRLASLTYPSGAELSYSYDSNGQLQAIQLNGDPLLSNIRHQPFGPVTGWQWANGESSQRDYDQDGRLIGHTLGDDWRNLGYDPVGNLISQTDNRDDRNYGYDALDRLLSAGGTDLDQYYQYDPNGNRTQLQESGRTTDYQIDTGSNRLLQSSDDTGGSVIQYSYDPNGNLIQDNNHSYQYDARNRLISVDDGAVAQYRYNPLGQRIRKQSGVDYQTLAEQYAQQARLHQEQARTLRTKARQKREEARTAERQAATQNRQAARIEIQAEQQTRQAQHHTIRAHNLQEQADQLAQWAQEMRDRIIEEPGNWWERLQNRIYQQLADHWQQQSDRIAEQAQQQLQLAQQAQQQAQILTQQAAQLREQANQLSQQAQALQQEAEQLAQQADQEIQLAQEAQQQADYYAQLAQDQNAPQVVTYFLYGEGGQLLGEYDETGQPVQETVWLGNLPVATVLNGTPFNIHPDHLGTPRVITDANQQVVWRWESEPFGNSEPDEDPDGNGTGFTYNLRFPGQYYDQETGRHYNYSRDYDPTTGRYIESDPIGLSGGLNTYTYVKGNPLRYTDLTGESSAEAIALWDTYTTAIGADAAVPEPTDAAPPKWIAWAVAGVVVAGVAVYLYCEDDEVDKGCEALYQSILATCSSLTGRKRFQCFEAARIAREQCYQERGK